jgi:hypothetical protein
MTEHRTTSAVTGALAVCMLAAMLLVGCAASPPPVPAGSAAQVPSGAPTGAASVEGGVQRIAIDVSKGYYDPTVVEAKAGVPLEITFGQGQGCLSEVLFPDFGVRQSLTQGGAVVKLPAMGPGERTFSCGMQMVFGKIVVR